MIALIASIAFSAQLQTVQLSSLDLSQIHQGWGKAMKDRSVTDTPLSIAGIAYPRGIGTHANSTFKVRLFGKATRFHSFCGVDDNAKSGRASVIFKVVGDGKELWKSPKLTWKTPAVEVNVSLKGVKSLSLEVGDAGDGVDYDHGDWADPTIEYNGKAPVSLVPPIEKPIILTPAPAKTPKINGPSVFGVRPGSPFLYLVPATGVVPIKYDAMRLPKGLSIDSKTGVISGSLKHRGTYQVILTAKNKLGIAMRGFKIVCGDQIALTPQMGWNSWYVWLDHVSDSILRRAGDAMIKTGLSRHGWQFVNIDDCWARVPGSKDPTLGGPTRDANGRLIPNGKFPDMKALTDYLHSKGLKAGIYTSPGPTTCAGYEGAFTHEALDAKTFADWGFDLLKYDWCSYKSQALGVPGFKKPYQIMGKLLKEQKRDMVFNLCQYGMGQVWKWGKEVGGHSWRTADDLGSGFTLFRDSFELYAREHLERNAGPGAFNDPDYLLLGKIAGSGGSLRNTPFTPNEQYTQVSMWSLLAAPLILSGDIATLDPFTLSLLTNDEILAVDQDSLVKAAHRVAKVGETEVWSRPLEDGSLAVGLFNTGEEQQPVKVDWSSLGIKGNYKVRDLWRQKDLGKFKGTFQSPVARHGVMMLKLTKQ